MGKLPKKRWVSRLRLHVAGMSCHFRSATKNINMDARMLDPRQYRRFMRAEAKCNG